MNRDEKLIIGVTFVAHALCHASVLVITGLLIPLRNEFGLSEFWVTALPLSGYVLMGVGAIPAGLIADRWGSRPVLGVYFALTAMSCALAAWAPNVWVFAGALTALGASVSLYHPTGLALISHGVRKRGHALGIHGIAGSIGLSGSALGLYMAKRGDWRNAYWIIAGVAMICAVVFPLLPIKDRPAPSMPLRPEGTDRSSGNGMWKVLVPLYLAMALSGFNYRSLMTALPTYLTAQSSGVYAHEGGRGGLVLVVFLLGGLSQYVSGRLADRLNPIYLYIVLVATSIPLAMALAMTAGVGNAAAVAAMALALAHFGTQPAENVLIAKYTPARMRSTSYGIKFFVTFGLGAIGAPIVGLLWNRTGTLAWTFVLFAAIALVVAIVILFLYRAVQNQAPEGDSLSP